MRTSLKEKKWVVEIAMSQWMAGIHRFTTKTKALAFMGKYKALHPNAKIQLHR